jgi:hypothetical protein
VVVEFPSHWNTQIFGVPTQARRAKPFIDHILTFSLLDTKIWFRNFQVRHERVFFYYYWKLTSQLIFFFGWVTVTGQIVEKDNLQPHGPPEMSLVEIGPRFVLTPIRIFEGAFGGATVFANPGTVNAHFFLAGTGQARYCFFVIFKAIRFFHPQSLFLLRLSGLRDARRGAKSTRNAS